jgi:hypothetical protein
VGGFVGGELKVRAIDLGCDDQNDRKWGPIIKSTHTRQRMDQTNGREPDRSLLKCHLERVEMERCGL